MTRRYQSLDQFFDGTGVRQRELARAVGVSDAAMSLYRAGKRVPEPAVAQRISKLTGIPLTNLLGLTRSSHV